MNFLKPVYINDKIKVNVEVLEITDKRRAMIKTECYKNESELVLNGSAKIILPPE